MKALAAAACGLQAAPRSRPLQLRLDLNVAPEREARLRANFRKVFRPAVSKQPNFVSVRLLKLRGAVAGEAPGDTNYRTVISFQSEEQRQAWVKSDDHQRAWPEVEKALRPGGLKAVLYDVV